MNIKEGIKLLGGWCGCINDKSEVAYLLIWRARGDEKEVFGMCEHCYNARSKFTKDYWAVTNFTPEIECGLKLYFDMACDGEEPERRHKVYRWLQEYYGDETGWEKEL